LDKAWQKERIKLSTRGDDALQLSPRSELSNI